MKLLMKNNWSLLLCEEATCLVLLSPWSPASSLSFLGWSITFGTLVSVPCLYKLSLFNKHDFQAFSPYKVKTSPKTNQSVYAFCLLFVFFPKQSSVLIMAQIFINILTLDTLSCLSLSYFMCKINHSCTSVKIL